MSVLLARPHGRVNTRYGGIRRWLLHWAFQILRRAGHFRKFEQIDWPRVTRVVFVCKGNICRSPYAEAKAFGLGLNVASLGLEADGHSSPDPLARKIAEARGVNLHGFFAKARLESGISGGDLLVGMEPWHARLLAVEAARSGSGAQVTLLGLWKTPPEPQIPDPYGLSEQSFMACFDVIDAAIDGIARRIRAQAVSASRLIEEDGGAVSVSIGTTRWRHAFPVLVVDAHAMGSIGVIRSLGRAGYPVHACSADSTALGLRSQYALSGVVCPQYHEPRFLPWLKDYVAIQGIRAIVPSEELLLTIRANFSEFSDVLPVTRQPDVLYAGLSKVDVFEALTLPGTDDRLGAHIPPSLVVTPNVDIPPVATLASLGTPLYIKVDSAYSDTGDAGTVHKIVSAEEARERLPEIMNRFRRALVQGYVPGQGVGVFFLIWNGEVRAEFMHRRLHEVPYTGGVSSLRASWWHQGIRDDALTKVRGLGWDGVVMMEYRWEPESDRFHFIEMNGRFWGSLHLALFSGVDFPVLLLDSFFGRACYPAPGFRLGLRCRYTFPKEMQYVWSRVKDRNLSTVARVWSILEFFLLGANPAVKSDLLFPGDRGLYWERFKRFLA